MNFESLKLRCLFLFSLGRFIIKNNNLRNVDKTTNILYQILLLLLLNMKCNVKSN